MSPSTRSSLNDDGGGSGRAGGAAHRSKTALPADAPRHTSNGCGCRQEYVRHDTPNARSPTASGRPPAPARPESPLLPSGSCRAIRRRAARRQRESPATQSTAPVAAVLNRGQTGSGLDPATNCSAGCLGVICGRRSNGGLSMDRKGADRKTLPATSVEPVSPVALAIPDPAASVRRPWLNSSLSHLPQPSPGGDTRRTKG